MQAFDHASPDSVEEAVKILAESKGQAAVLAGGTDLLALMKDGVLAPRRVVSLRRIEALRGVSSDAAGALSLGALATLDDLLASAAVRDAAPALAQAAQGVTSAQMRAMGTVGGDLCQWPRCWYFRQGFGLLAARDGKSLVEEGDNRYHAVLGNEGAAKFVSASSLGPPLIALGATLEIAGPMGRRSVEAGAFFRAPRAEGERPCGLAADEILTSVKVPARGLSSATCEIRQKRALDWPLATASVALSLKDGKLSEARIVLGHVAPVPWIAKEAAAMLVGQAPGADVAERAAGAAVAEARPLSHNAYKVELARVAVRRAVLAAAGRQA